MTSAVVIEWVVTGTQTKFHNILKFANHFRRGLLEKVIIYLFISMN